VTAWPENAVAGAGSEVLEVPVTVEHPVVGQHRSARVHVGESSLAFEFTLAEPGWTMFMVSHFHYDPVWWNTQGAYTSEWREDPPGSGRQANGFELVHAHLEMARREPEYKFVLAEVDYLKPYWDTHPEDRADLRRFLAEGRLEVMGGTYNEPNTNLTGPETTIRNLVHGIGFQRDVLGADPATAGSWTCSDTIRNSTGMAADAGLTSSSWARGTASPMGPHPRRGRGPHAVLQRVRVDRAVGPRPAHPTTCPRTTARAGGWNRRPRWPRPSRATYALFGQLKKSR